MRTIIAILLFASIVSCKSKPKQEAGEESTSSIGDVVNSAKSLQNISSSMDDIQKQQEKLKTTTPISNDELKTAFPETVMGLKRTSISVGQGSAANLSMGEAQYENEAKDKKIEISITDGAGETGSGMIMLLLMALKTESEKTTETGFEKTTTFNGVKAMVEEDKTETDKNAQITYIYKDRYNVKIDGNGYSLDELKPVMDAINSSNLK